MSLSINNDSAIGFALIALSRSSNLMNEAIERLSTGKSVVTLGMRRSRVSMKMSGFRKRTTLTCSSTAAQNGLIAILRQEEMLNMQLKPLVSLRVKTKWNRYTATMLPSSSKRQG